MGKSIQSVDEMEALLGPDPLSEALRGKIRELILTLAEEYAIGASNLIFANL